MNATINNPRIDDIAILISRARDDEREAAARRYQLEHDLFDAIRAAGEDVPDEGARTLRTARFKIVLDARVTRKLDIAKAADALNSLPPEVRPVRVVADETALKHLSENHPDAYRALLPYITTTPGKVGVKVEIL